MFTKEQRKWIIFYRKMSEGKIPYESKFYCFDRYVTNDQINAEYQKRQEAPTFQPASPTQQQVDQPKTVIERKLKESVQSVL